jgi:hypothetical protein
MPKSHVFDQCSTGLGIRAVQSATVHGPANTEEHVDADDTTLTRMSWKCAQIQRFTATLGCLAQRAVLAWAYLGRAGDGLRTGPGVSWTGDRLRGHHQPWISILDFDEYDCLGSRTL